MARDKHLARPPQPRKRAGAGGSSLRLRAAWLYYSRGWTQAAIADDLGVSRSTVIRMLDEARARNEVQVWINASPDDCTELAISLEQAFGLREAIVVPGEGSVEDTARDVGAALGRYLSQIITDNMLIGATWGRTLNAALGTFRPAPRSNTRVVSLLGGTLRAKGMNPIDFSWQLASRLNGECMLYLAPLIVNSPETKSALIEQCGLDRLHEAARALDLAIISCGDLGAESSSSVMELIGPDDRAGLLAAGAICDAGCNFLDAEGRDVDHPLRDRVMSVDLGTIARAGHIVLASGGAHRAAAIRATILRTGCQTLITNEAAAKALLTL
jgi:DNA-binding transcriptional regulator LsrR (DeoR family)